MTKSKDIIKLNKLYESGMNIRQAAEAIGISRPTARKLIKNKRSRKGLVCEKSHRWKGDAAGYNAKHTWIYRRLGKANMCVRCGVLGKKRYDWANISGEYKRDVNDYQQMCAPCHLKMDFRKTGCCRRGHLSNKENTYSNPSGVQSCRVCRTENRHKKLSEASCN